jgi:hypothetical protein
MLRTGESRRGIAGIGGTLRDPESAWEGTEVAIRPERDMTMRASNRLPAFILVDAHVHLHPCFDTDSFLDSAVANFERGAAQVGVPRPYTGCLLLAESRETHWFRDLRLRLREEERPGGVWTFSPTEEDCSVVAQRVSGERLFLIAGRQIVSREGVEVLALGRDAEIPDRLKLAETLSRVRGTGALPVLPWGFGKWWLRRGSLVAEAFRRRGSEELFLGDNGGRLAMTGLPRLFRESRAEGVPVLPGSDPLPFAEHGGRAGSYGFVLSGSLDEERPTACVLRAIRRLKGQPRIFGRCAGLTSFVHDQAAVQWRRRAGTEDRDLPARSKVAPEALP